MVSTDQDPSTGTAVPSAAQLLDAYPAAQLVFTPDLVLVAVNERHLQMTGRRAADILGRPMFEAFPKNPDQDGPDTETVIRASVERVVASGEPDDVPLQKHDLERDDGGFDERYWQITHCPIKGDGKVVQILQTSRDVTEEILRSRVLEAKQRAARLGAGLSFFEYDPATDSFVRGREVDEVFGFAPGEAGETAAAFFERIHRDDIDNVMAEIERVLEAPPNTIARHDYRIILPGGDMRWVIARSEIIRDPRTQSPRLVGVIMDVSDIKWNEARLEEAVAVQDVLLGEVNHRVKNSLQLVTSILRMEAAGALGTPAEDRLAAAAARIQAVASVHANLYHADDVRTVAMATFVPQFCQTLAAAGGADERNVQLSTEVDDILLPTDTAIAVALIVNELVTNAFKHAFGKDGGTIRLTLRDGDGRLALTVRDDGNLGGGDVLGSTDAPAGFGTTLIRTLAKQLGAELHQKKTHPGYEARLVFSLEARPGA